MTGPRTPLHAVLRLGTLPPHGIIGMLDGTAQVSLDGDIF